MTLYFILLFEAEVYIYHAVLELQIPDFISQILAFRGM